MIHYGSDVHQQVDRGLWATFRKEIVVTSGAVPLAMVRKRWIGHHGATRAPLLLVHGFGQNRYAWHLPSRSLANHLAHEGFDVFNLDLRGHGRSRHLSAGRSTGVDDYVREDIPRALAEVQALSGDRAVFLVGHSLGGLVSYAAAPALGDAVAGIVSIGSPYHFTRGSMSLGAIAIFFRAMNAARIRPKNMPLSLSPVSFTFRAMRGFIESPFYPVPLRGWHSGSCEPEVLEEHLRLAFDRVGIAEMIDMFEWAAQKKFGGQNFDYGEAFESLDRPLLVIAGSNDDLAPLASVRPGFQRSRSRDKTFRSLPLGHIDLLVGRDAPRSTWPIVSGWIGQRAQHRAA